jgi:hypothetical protein
MDNDERFESSISTLINDEQVQGKLWDQLAWSIVR